MSRRLDVISSHTRQPEFENRIVNCNGVNISCRYTGRGNGLPLLIIRGLGMTKEDSDSLSRRMSSERRVVTIDNRGSGESDTPDSDYTFEDMASDCVTVMQSFNNCNKFHVLGVSMGGCIALQLAFKYQKHVASLTIGCSYATKGEDIGVPMRYREMTMADMPSEASERSAHIRELFEYSFTKEWIANNQTTFSSLLADYESAEVKRLSKPNGRGQEKAIMAFLSTGMLQDLPSIRCPTMAITGCKDEIVPFKNSIQLSQKIPNCYLAVIPNAGHLFWEMDPQISCIIMLNFLKRND